jgi:hypothetical protein
MIAGLAPAAVTLDAVKDTYVELATPDTPYGLTDSMLVRNDGDFRISFVSFDISTLTADVSSASFEVTKLSGRGDRDTYVWGITDESFDSWSEATLTWNSASVIPGSQTDAGSTSAEVELGTLIILPRDDGVVREVLNDPDGVGGDPISAGANDDLVSFLNDDTNGIVTFAIHHRGPALNGNDYSYATRENLLQDSASLIVEVVPEPTSLLLLAPAAGLLLSRRRGISRV